MDGLITLADLPELAGTDPAPRTQITVARLDDNLRDPRYGKFGITQADVDGWKRNLSDVFGGRVAIDEDHSSDRGKGTKAVAWITGLSQQGRQVRADVEFTPQGAQKIRDKEYLYISPTFVDNYKDEHGQSHGKALLGAAVTNRPVLRKDMPTLSLSRDDFADVAATTARPRKKGSKKQRRARQLARDLTFTLSRDGGQRAARGTSDSRATMDPKTLAKQLGLAEDADEATILAKITELAAPAPAEKPKKLAKGKKSKKSKGKTLTLSAEKTAELISDANAGKAAALQLHEERFASEWTKTLSEGRVAPAQEDEFKALFAQAPDLAIKTLSGMQRIVPTRPRGSGETPATDGPAPDGMDQNRFELHQQATARARELSKSGSMTFDEAYQLAAVQLDDELHGVEGSVI